MPRVTANGLSFHLETAGTGPPLLFLGGTGWDLRRTRLPLTPPLTAHFTVALYDQRGQGQSAKPPGPYSMRDYAADAIGVLEALGWARAHIIGYSFGGMVAQEVAIRWPDRVDRLVLAATTAGGAGGASYPIHEFQDLPPDLRARRGLEIADTRFSMLRDRDPDAALARIRQRAENQTRFAHEPGAIDGLRRQLGARAGHDTFDRLTRIEAPTLVLAGAFDGQAPAEAVQAMSERIPGAVFRTLPGPHDFIADWQSFCEITIGHLAGGQDGKGP